MKLPRLFFVLALSMVLSLAFATIAHADANLYIVTSTGDQSAVDPSVGCDIGDGNCTLRSAIEALNIYGGASLIEFSIPGDGVHTITPISPLPNITTTVTIDGSTQPGASCGTLVPASLPATNTPHNLLVVINTNNVSGMSALHFANGSSNSVVRGLVMNGTNTDSDTLYVDTVGTDNMLIECNYFGTNASGSTVVGSTHSILYMYPLSTIQNNLFSGSTGNGLNIVYATAQNNLIGTDATGTTALANAGNGLVMANSSIASHNVVSGNGGAGIYTNSGGTITGNFIGINIHGSQLGNGGAGIAVYGANGTVIGGVSANQRNVISANGGDGIHIYSDCNTHNSIASTTFNNYIGTNSGGSVQAGFGNQQAGIEVNEYNGSCESVYNHQIGGDGTGQPNIIAGNTGQGVLIHQGADNDVFSITTIGNSIYGNGQFGIDLASDSGNNGDADVDLGPNALNSYLMSYPTAGHANYYLNKPTINSTSFSGNQLTMNYAYQAQGVEDNLPSISSEDVVGYRIDVYLNDNAQDGAYAGYAQGKTHLGSFIVNGSESNASHTFTSSAPLTSSMSVSASATVLWTTTPSGGRDGTRPPYSNPK